MTDVTLPPADSAPLTRTVPPEAEGRPLAELIRSWLGAEAAAPALERGGVWLEGRRLADPQLPAPAGARLTVHRPPDGRYAEVTVTPADLCYEDEWLLALNKRAGWYTGATPWDTQGNALAALERWLCARDGQPPTLHLAHQLDRDTSGVLLFSKRPAVNAPLQAAFAGGGVHKRYDCICWGEPDDEAFVVRSGHGRSSGGRWRLYPLEQVGMALPGGGRVRLAHTSFRLVERLGGAAWLHAEPHTGRTHQIRLHLAGEGRPLLGDTRYGGPSVFRGETLRGHLLHAARLCLVHPFTGQPLDLVADLPAHMRAVLRAAP